MIVAVIDGMGGGIGAQIVSSLREELPSYIDVYALGTNSIATSAMMKSHANKGATGENAIIVSVKKVGLPYFLYLFRYSLSSLETLKESLIF